MSLLNELNKAGQSVWLDYILRSFLESGELVNLIKKGITGVTSNPAIFENAINQSSDYDSEIFSLIERGSSVEDIYEELALKDISTASEQLMDVYDITSGRDGYVSLEVSPDLAYNTEKTISEAIRLFERLNRPNVLIKVPATEEGLPAIRKLISVGVNVNVTLIFDNDFYDKVISAYIEGLDELLKTGPSVKGGHNIGRVSSVASFFISRVDTAVDQELSIAGIEELKGKIAIANAKEAYDLFQTRFSGRRWDWFKEHGARVQRPLWASTGTKDPDYPDTLYVDELIGRDTVNTLPLKTINNFLDHGTVSGTLTKNLDTAWSYIEDLEKAGIQLEKITRKLQKDGVDSFAKSFETLLKSIDEKKDSHMAGKK